MISSAFEKTIEDKIPGNAVAYCVSLFEKTPFGFRVNRDRKSKSGDYRHDRSTKKSTVTVNSGLNPYAFLITLIHEIAHHTARLGSKRKIQPHGSEWKLEFKTLMLPLVNPLVFPDDILPLLARHLKNPKASTWSDAKLVMALKSYDEEQPDESETYLSEVESGISFYFNNRRFTKIEKRRTRVLCLDHNSGRKYLIPQVALVRVDTIIRN